MGRDLTPGKDLLLQVRIAFIQQGTSLSRWCRENGTTHAYAHQALTGKGSYPAIIKFRKRLLVAAGVIELPVKTGRRKQA